MDLNVVFLNDMIVMIFFKLNGNQPENVSRHDRQTRSDKMSCVIIVTRLLISSLSQSSSTWLNSTTQIEL